MTPLPSKTQVRGIYKGIDQLRIPIDTQGWNSTAPIFERLIVQTAAEMIIEIGSWKGASAIHMATMCKKHGIQPLIFCVDFWQDPILHTAESMIPQRWDAGFSAYHQFLRNVLAAGHDDCIIPIRTWSPHGAPLLRSWDIRADLIYIDGGHTEADCACDIGLYWPLLRKGGVMFGDDWCMDGVRRAVTAMNPIIELHEPHWQYPPKP